MTFTLPKQCSTRQLEAQGNVSCFIDSLTNEFELNTTPNEGK